MPKKELITCQVIPAGSNPLSQGTSFGNLLFIQGCTGRHPTTEAVGKDIKEQTQFALDRIKAFLEAGGSSLDDVLTNTCYISNREDLPASTKFTPRFSPTTGRRGPQLLST